jgi:hypothetical protein
MKRLFFVVILATAPITTWAGSGLVFNHTQGNISGNLIVGSSVSANNFYGNASNMSGLYVYESTTVFNSTAAYFSTSSTLPVSCITGSTLTFTAVSGFTYEGGFSGGVAYGGGTSGNMGIVLDGTLLTPFSVNQSPARWSTTTTIAWRFPFTTTSGAHNICFPMWGSTGVSSIPQYSVVTFSIRRVK